MVVIILIIIEINIYAKSNIKVILRNNSVYKAFKLIHAGIYFTHDKVSMRQTFLMANFVNVNFLLMFYFKIIFRM